MICITFKTFITFMNTAARITKYIEQDLPVKILSWLAYLFNPIIESIVISTTHLLAQFYRSQFTP
jgi:hypothetical protein